MTAPPFRLAHGAPGAVAALCCTPRAVPAPAAAAARRARLGELDANLHCSLIGTCIGTAALRKLVARCQPDLGQASALEVHHRAVQLARDGGAGSKALHKALDALHAAPVKRLAALRDAQALGEAWQQALASGEVPGTYWAVMTHACATPALRKRAFGDVHMLSHLVGAANRADIRRLQALEQRNAELIEQVERQQRRLLQLAQERQQLAGQMATRPWLASPPAAAPDAAARQAERAAYEQVLAHQTRRREAAESQMQAERNAREALQQRMAPLLELVDSLQAELQALEGQMAAQLGPGPAAHAALQGLRVVYVGGRPASNRSIRALVQAAGGELVLHDGGVEDRKGLLTAALPRADLVVFPVDCVDHDSVGTVKRLCERHGVPFHPVRSASAASFAALLAQLARDAPAGPRLCRRHA